MELFKKDNINVIDLSERHKDGLDKLIKLANNGGICFDVLPLHPETGRYIEVNGFPITENHFNKEFNEISKIYFSVLEKLRNMDEC